MIIPPPPFVIPSKNQRDNGNMLCGLITIQKIVFKKILLNSLQNNPHLL